MTSPAARSVLFVTRWYPSHSQPTRSEFVRDHALAASRHVRVAVVHCVGPLAELPGGARIEEETDTAVTAAIPTVRVYHTGSRVPGVTVARYFGSVVHGIRTLGRQGFHPDLIHAHVFETGPPAALAARLLRVPYVITEHTTRLREGGLSLPQRLALRVAYSTADRVLPVSRALQRDIVGYGVRARFEVVPNVIGDEFFDAAAARDPSTPSAGRRRRIVSVTSFTEAERKGIPDLLAALVRLQAIRRDWMMEIIGGGESLAHYRGRASALGLADSVVFSGQLTRGQVVERLGRADLFVLSSLIETFSVATAEALAMGVPVVVTACGGPEEYVTGEAGRVVPPGEPERLATAIGAMLDQQPPERAALSRRIRERYSLEAIGSRLRGIYTQVLAGRGAGGRVRPVAPGAGAGGAGGA